MYELVQQIGIRTLVIRELPYLAITLIIAELFYKFHSFTLEAVAFLVTWYLLSWVGAIVFPNRRQG